MKAKLVRVDRGSKPPLLYHLVITDRHDEVYVSKEVGTVIVGYNAQGQTRAHYIPHKEGKVATTVTKRGA